MIAAGSQVVHLEDPTLIGGGDPVDRLLASYGNSCVLHYGAVDIQDRSPDGAFRLNILSVGHNRSKA